MRHIWVPYCNRDATHLGTGRDRGHAGLEQRTKTGPAQQDFFETRPTPKPSKKQAASKLIRPKQCVLSTIQAGNIMVASDKATTNDHSRQECMKQQAGVYN